LALLNEAHKLDIYEKKAQLTIAAFPDMDKEQKETLMQEMELPDDLLGAIVDSEHKDDINTLKEAFDGN